MCCTIPRFSYQRDITFYFSIPVEASFLYFAVSNRTKSVCASTQKERERLTAQLSIYRRVLDANPRYCTL